MLAKQTLHAFFVFVILICCLYVSAQTQTSTSDDSTNSSITGSVVSDGGQPLAGASVFVRNVNPAVVPMPHSARTAADGSFRIKNLEPGLYSIFASLPAYVTQQSGGVVQPTYIRVGDSVRIEMMRGAVITGTVTNASGEPLIGVRVRVMMIRNAKGERPPYGIVSQERTTDDRGIYRAFGLTPGTYLVSAGGSGNSQGYVLNPYDGDIPTYAPSSTRDNASELTVHSGEEGVADIRYRGEAGHRVTGIARTSGADFVSVALIPVGALVGSGNAVQPRGSNGFVFLGVADGQYDVIAQEATSVIGKASIISMSEPLRITVKGADVTGLELATRPLGSISGRIVFEPARTPDCQGKRRPLFEEMLVMAERSERIEKNMPPYLRPTLTSASPDAQGNFALRNLTSGRYFLEPRFFARYWYLSSIRNGDIPRVDPAASWTTLRAGDQLTNFTITLSEGAASVRGRVANSNGVSSQLGVYMLPAEREKITDLLHYFVTSVAADGTFALNSLPPGRYLALVQALDADTNTIAKLRSPDAAEARVKLRRAADVQKAALELKPCQNVTDLQLDTKQ